MSNKKTLSPLEILAINDLPEKSRIARIAYLCRTYRFKHAEHRRQDVKLIHAKAALEKFGEPRGAKGRLTRELCEEWERQRGVSNARELRNRTKKYSYRWLDSYDPVAYRMIDGASEEARVKAIVQSRLYQWAQRHDKSADDILPVWARSWWSNRIYNHQVRDAKIIDGGYYLLVKPGYVNINGSKQYEHRFQWLLRLKDDHLEVIRVDVRMWNVHAAINSLKKSQVKTAESKNYEVKINWQDRCFLVKSTRKWREIPFKKWSRE